LKHLASPEFWASYRALPKHVQQLADEKFRLLKTEPRHPSLRLKKVGRFWSCRVGLHHRAVGLDAADHGAIAWFWIGTHADYDKLLG
jgi:hypothetical protein